MKRIGCKLLCVLLAFPFMMACNDDNDPDTTALTITSDDPLVTVGSDGKSATVTFQLKGREIVLNVETGLNWQPEIIWKENSGQENWLTAIRNAKALTLEAADLESGIRNAIVNIRAGGNIIGTITVIQKKDGATEEPYLELDKQEAKFLANGGEETIGVDTNAEWKYRVEGENTGWLTPNQNKEESTLKLVAGKVTDGNDRKATVYVTIGEGEGLIEKKVDVFQRGDNPMMMEITIDKDNTTIQLPFMKKVDITVNPGDGGEVFTVKNDNVYWEPIEVTYKKAGKYILEVTGSIQQISKEVIYPAIYDEETGDDISMKYLTALINWGDITGIDNLSGAFSTSSLTTVPSPDPGLFADVVSCTGMFEGCRLLKKVPGDLFADCEKNESFESVFRGCSSLEEIPEDIFANSPQNISFESVFRGCSALEEVPGGIFANSPQNMSFSSAFEGCTSLKELNAEWFKNSENVSMYMATFRDCSSIKSIPSDIFHNSPNVNWYGGFEYTFTKCTSLQQIPADLFVKQPDMDSFGATFAGCASLTSIPPTLLEKQTALFLVDEMFLGCESLTTIPETLFANCPELSRLTSTFAYCFQLSEIPAKLFENNKEIQVLAATFLQAKIESIPAGLFDGCSYIRAVPSLFAGCRSLKHIPDGLFASTNRIDDAEEIFYKCTSLEKLPRDLFETNKAIDNLKKAFAECTSLTGESPYSIVNGNKSHLYQRTYPSEHSGCFYKCTGLDDYQYMKDNHPGWVNQ